ncbi:hypothetical protein OsJ_00162 [Oryza sativa Japonica Group]|uniref:Glycosyltransferase 61 catalytic domain-containing protein n=1 Tax=Oryza sativa subsp. japonica TaxID=39947 RepID=A2ZNN0_ORYSJ|nr:hypothetical protein OsJ_00162 [Oryza sativa Japonica Group]
MVDFTRFLRHAYGLRRDKPMVLGETSGKKPRMLIISRRRTRKLLNLRQVAAMARELGFEVVVSEAGVGGGSGGVKRFASAVNSCDVLVGVHGAGLTNQAFLPRGGVVVQIVPWGRMEWMATNFYGAPAAAHGAQGLKALADIVMTQDFKLNLRRFRPKLLRVLDLLQD